MIGAAKRRQISAREAVRIAKSLRPERLRTMRYYRRKRMYQALQRARLELALRRSLPPIILFTVLAAAGGVVIGFAVRWWLA